MAHYDQYDQFIFSFLNCYANIILKGRLLRIRRGSANVAALCVISGFAVPRHLVGRRGGNGVRALGVYPSNESNEQPTAY